MISRRSNIYSGPKSDHFDGERFFDPDGATPKALRDLLRWQFDRDRKRAKWPDWEPSPFSDRPPARVDGGTVRLSFVGHASWLIQTAGLNILVDPVWSVRVSPFAWAGRGGTTIPASRSRRCLQSMSCWYRMATTTISMSPRSQD